MLVQTELREMFSYSFLPIIFFSFLIGLIIASRFMKVNGLKKEIIIPSQKDLGEIKKQYLLKIKKLESDLEKISKRKAYQELSNIIRNFIFEATNINVQNYTLREIKMIDMPILAELIDEYYGPEFSVNSDGDIILSINKTRMVIEKWN